MRNGRICRHNSAPAVISALTARVVEAPAGTGAFLLLLILGEFYIDSAGIREGFTDSKLLRFVLAYLDPDRILPAPCRWRKLTVDIQSMEGDQFLSGYFCHGGNYRTMGQQRRER